MIGETTVDLGITLGLQLTRNLKSEETTVNLDTTFKLQFIHSLIAGEIMVNLDIVLELYLIRTLVVGELYLIRTLIVGETNLDITLELYLIRTLIVGETNLDITLELYLIRTLIVGEITVNLDLALELYLIRTLILTLGEITANPDTGLGVHLARVMMIAIGYPQSTTRRRDPTTQYVTYLKLGVSIILDSCHASTTAALPSKECVVGTKGLILIRLWQGDRSRKDQGLKDETAFPGGSSVQNRAWRLGICMYLTKFPSLA